MHILGATDNVDFYRLFASAEGCQQTCIPVRTIANMLNAWAVCMYLTRRCTYVCTCLLPHFGQYRCS